MSRSRRRFRFHRPETLDRVAHPGTPASRFDTSRQASQSAPARHRGPAPCPDHGHPQSGEVARRGPSAGAHPDGQRRRQDLHRLQFRLSAHQVRRRAAASCSSWTAAISAGRRSRSSSSSSRPTRTASSPSFTTSSTCNRNKLDDVSTRLHHHHSAPLLHAEGRGDSIPTLEEQSGFEAATRFCKRAGSRSATTPAFPSRPSTSSSPTSAIAPSTTSGGRCSNTSTPSSSA